MEEGMTLDQARKLIRREGVWIGAIGIACLIFCFVLAFAILGAVGEVRPEMAWWRKVVHIPFTLASLPFLGIIFALLKWSSRVDFKNRQPIRAAKTSEVIAALDSWDGKAAQELRHELLERAHARYRRARNYFYGRPADGFEDRDGLGIERRGSVFPALSTDSDRITVLSRDDGFVTLRTEGKGGPGPRFDASGGTRLLKLLFGLAFLSILGRDWGDAFDSHPIRLISGLLMFAPILLPLQIAKRQSFAMPTLDQHNLSLNQLLFILVRSRSAALRAVAAKEVIFLGRLQKPAEEACLRLGLYVRDATYPRGYRVKGLD